MRVERRGAVLLEFALTIPIFLLMLLGIMEFASLFFVRHAMLHAAGDACRSYAINESTAEEAEQLALDELSGVNATFTVTTSSQTATALERWVEVSVPVGDASLGDPLNVLSGDSMTVRVTMRREEQP